MEEMKNTGPRVCIVLVNYKTWRDTAECMESLMKSKYGNFQIVVVENGSEDDSMEKLTAWAEGRELMHGAGDFSLSALSTPPATKPLEFAVCPAERSATLEAGTVHGGLPLLYIENARNAGFAGGNNIGLRYALHNTFDYVWLLNNDTVTDPDALDALVDFARKAEKEGKKYGIIGSKLLLYHKPQILQGLGARFNRYSGKSKIIGAREQDLGQYDNMPLEMNYVIGASMFVPKAFLEDVGLMSESYFLYNEENDWSARGRLRGWSVGTAVASKVYHKQGTSTGNSPKKKKWQRTALHYKYRGKILLYKKYYRRQLPFLYLHLFTRSMHYLLRGQFPEAGVIFGEVFGGSSTREKTQAHTGS